MAQFCQELCAPPCRLLLPLFFRLLAWTVLEFGEGCPWKSFSLSLSIPAERRRQLPFLTNFNPHKIKDFSQEGSSLFLKDANIGNALTLLSWASAFVLWWQLFVIQTNVIFSCLIFTRQDQWLRMSCRRSQLPSVWGGRSCLQRCFGCQHSPSSHRAIFYWCWMNGLQSCVTFCALPGCSSAEFFQCP